EPVLSLGETHDGRAWAWARAGNARKDELISRKVRSFARIRVKFLNLPSRSGFDWFMAAQRTIDDLLEHLAGSTRLSRAEAERVVAEILEYFSESTEEFVVRRHAELRADELRNPDIFGRIADEVRLRRFVAQPLTERQIRRLIYG